MDFVLDFILNKIGYEKKYLDYRERVGLLFGLQVCAGSPTYRGEIRMSMGCLTAAGYTWSELRGDCIRIFEDGVRVDDPSLQPSLASYAVFAADSGRVEVFRPSPFRNEILDRKGGVWQGKTCKLYRTGDRWELREK